MRCITTALAALKLSSSLSIRGHGHTNEIGVDCTCGSFRRRDAHAKSFIEVDLMKWATFHNGQPRLAKSERGMYFILR